MDKRVFCYISFGSNDTVTLGIAALLLLFLPGPGTHATAAPDTTQDATAAYVDTALNIGSVRIQGSRMKEIIAPQRLEGEELQKLNALSVADAIRYFSGAQLKDYGGVGGLKTIDIRSMGSAHVGVYYDGIQLGNAMNGQIDLGKFSLDNVEVLSVYNGQRSEIFQGAKDFGSGGALYIETRRPTFSTGKSSNARIGAKAGSFGLLNVSALAEHKLAHRLSGSLNAEWLHAHGRYKFRYYRKANDGSTAYDTTAVRQNGDINAVRLEGGLFGMLPGGNWRLRGYHYGSNRGLPGAIVNNVWRRGEKLTDRNSFAQFSLRTSVTSWFRMQIATKYAYDYTQFVGDISSTMQNNIKYQQQEAFASLANLFTIRKWWEASLAYDFSYSTLLTRMEPSGKPTFNFPYPSRYSHYLAAATAVEQWGLKLQASILGYFILNRAKQFRKPANVFDYTPAVFLSYTPLERLGLSLRAFWKKSLRLPTFNDLYYVDHGSPQIEPEYVTQYNVGFDWQKSWPTGVARRANITCDAYYNEVHNKIVAYPKGQQFRWTMINLGFVKIKGVDANAAISIVPWDVLTISTKLQYTYQDSRDWTNPKDKYYGHRTPYSAHHSGSAIGGIAWREWSINYSFIYVGERYSQQENIIYNLVLPWYTHDFSLAWDGKIKSVGLRIVAEVNNLLGYDYEVIVNYPMPKINYKFSTCVTF